MVDENTVTQDPIETGELSDEATDQDISTELPDQPDELRAKATEIFKENAELKRSKRQVEESAEELKASADYFKIKTKELEDKLATRTPEPQARAPKPAEKPKLIPREKLDNILASDDGGEQLQAIIEEAAERKAREMMASTKEATNEQAAALQKLAGPYPDLLKNGSELQVAASRHLIRIEREMSGLSPDATLIMATQAAALEIGYKPNQAVNGIPPSSERLRNAQSAPHGRKPDTKPSAAPVDPSTEKFAKKHGVPMDATSRKIIADLAAQNARGTARK